MDIEYLREFVCLVQYGEFTLASEKLFISQPTLSRHIKSLEDELRVPLLVRTSQKVELTPFGETLSVYAKDVLKRTEDLQKTIAKISRTKENTVRIFFSYPIHALCEGFSSVYPGYTVELIKNDPPRTQSEQIDLLAKESCDFMLTALDDRHSATFSSLFLRTDQLCVLVSRTHPLAARDSIGIEELKNETFLMWSRGSFEADFAEQACQDAGFAPQISIRTGDGSYLATATHLRGGIYRLGVGVFRLCVSGKGVGGDGASSYFGGVATHAGGGKRRDVPWQAVAVHTNAAHL